MLPKALAGTYGQYKHDTAVVTTWLATAATLLGFRLTGSDNDDNNKPPSTPPTTGRLKGKARAQAKSKAKAGESAAPSVPTNPPAKRLLVARDLLPMAELVAKHKTLVPAHIKTMLDSAITTRAKFAVAFVPSGGVFDANSSATHEFFLSLLVQVREHLQTHEPVTKTSPVDAARTGTQNPTLTNRFHGLTVSEPSQQFLDAPDVTFTNPFDPATAAPGPRPKPPKLADLLKSETDKLLNGKPTTQADFVNSILGAEEFADIDWEVKFAFSLLIGDLMTLRARIRWVWDNVKIYKKNLMEAAIATDTAVQLAESMISAVMPLIDRDGGMHRMLCLEFLEHCAGGGIKVDHILDGEESRVSSVTAFSDASYEIADRMFFNTWQLLYFHLYCIPYSKTEINVYDDGKYDRYNPACNHDALPFKAKMANDKSLSQALFTDLTAIVRNRPGFPVRDALLSCWEIMDKTREPLFHAAFAIQIYLDIAYTMGKDISAGFDHLMIQVADIEEDVQANLTFHKEHNLDSPKEKARDGLEFILETISSLRTDPVGAVSIHVKEDLGIPLSAADRKGHRLLRRSPVLSGLLLFSIRSDYRCLSFRIANAHASLLCGQHLYHAISILEQEQNRRQGKAVQEQKWHDMEILHGIFPSDSFYPGGAMPKDLEQCFKRLALQLGLSPTSFSKNRRPTTSMRGKSGPRGLKPPAAVMSLLESRYRNDEKNEMMTDELLERIIEQSRFEFLDVVKARSCPVDPSKTMAVTVNMQPIADEEVLREKARKAAAYFGNEPTVKATLDASWNASSASPRSTRGQPVQMPPRMAALVESEFGDKSQPSSGSPSADSPLLITSSPNSSKAQTMMIYHPVDGEPELVFSLYFSLQAESMEFSFPYLRMHRQCCKLMLAVRDSVDPYLNALLSDGSGNRGNAKENKNKIGGKAQRDGLSAICFTLMVASSTHRLGVPMLKPMEVAQQVLQKWLPDNGAHTVNKHFSKAEGTVLQRMYAPGWEKASGQGETG